MALAIGGESLLALPATNRAAAKTLCAYGCLLSCDRINGVATSSRLIGPPLDSSRQAAEHASLTGRSVRRRLVYACHLVR